VRTVGDGTVEFAGVQRGYGNVIYIKHTDNTDTTVYGHLSRIGVREGEKVTQGQKIGEVGSTGVATGPHLHFEFRVNGEPVDPQEVMAQQHQPRRCPPRPRGLRQAVGQHAAAAGGGSDPGQPVPVSPGSSPNKNAPLRAHFCWAAGVHSVVNDEPQPQVVEALGLRITNCAPFRSSL
jgi:murein DD-endopeptidase MepM/ murein hydrolase activator NlpD